MTEKVTTRAEYLENARAIRAKREDRCPVSLSHASMSTCQTCGMYMPCGGFTTEELNVYREGWMDWSSPSTTSPEWRAEIFAATGRYEEAVAALQRAADAWGAAVVRERIAGRANVVDAAGGGIIYPDPSFLSRAEASTDAAAEAFDRAEPAAAAALRELNRVSLPAHLREAPGPGVEQKRRGLMAFR